MFKKELFFPISIITCFGIFLVGCFPTTEEPTLNEESLIVIPKKKDIPLKSNVENQLGKLPKPSELQSYGEVGKIDPFKKDSSIGNRLINRIKLRGIISEDSGQYALVEYRKKTGVIKIDQIGEETTTLLPKGVKVKNIDIKEEHVILSNEGVDYILGIWNN